MKAVVALFTNIYLISTLVSGFRAYSPTRLCTITHSSRSKVSSTPGSQEDEPLKHLMDEALRCTRSRNPLDWLKVSRLKSEIDFRRLQRDELRLQRDELRLQRDEETKVIYIYSGDDEQGSDRPIKRKTFNAWAEKDRVLKRHLPNGKFKPVWDFDDIVLGDEYTLSISYKNFEAFSEVEADVQIRDVVASVLNGSLSVPPFNEPETMVLYNYPIDPPKEFIRDSDLGFQFPVKPDAILVHGQKWLVIEAKHKCTNSDILLFSKKLQFIERNKGEGWVRKRLAVPDEIIGAVSSIGDYSKSKVVADPTILLIIRDGLQYKLV